MKFAHFADFQALPSVDRTVPKKIVIFIVEMNIIIRCNPSQNAAFFTKSEHTIKLSSSVSTV